MDPRDSSRLQDRIQEASSADKSAKSNSNEPESTCSMLPRNFKYDGKRGNPSSERSSEPIHLKSFYCSKEYRGFQTSDQPKISESFHPIRAFQDGIHPACETFDKQIKFYDYSRSQRCILHGTNLPPTSEISPLSVGGNFVRVSGPTFRPYNGTSGIHQTDETSGSPSETEVHESCDLLRRSVTDITVNGGMPPSERLYPEIVQSARIGSKHGKVPTCSIPKSKILRSHDRFNNHDPQSSSRQNPQYSVHVQTDNWETSTESRHSSKSTGKDDSYIRECSFRPPLLQGAPIRPDQICTRGSNIPESDQSFSSQHPRTGVVGRMLRPVQRETGPTSMSSASHMDRCIHPRLGGPLLTRSNRGQVDAGRAETPHQLPRVTGSVSSSSEFCTKHERLSYHHSPRQYNRLSLYQTQRGDSHRQSVELSSSTLEVVPEEEYHAVSIPHSRQREHHCRPSLQSLPGQNRVEAEPCTVQETVQEPQFSADHRPFRIQDECSTDSLRGLETRSGGIDSQRLFNSLDERTKLCVSALLSIGPSLAQSDDGQCNNANYSPYMDNPILVSHAFANGNHSPSLVADVDRSSNSTPLRPTTPADPVSTPGGVDCLRRHYESEGFSKDLIEVMLSSCRQSTHRQYESAWKHWSSWCGERSLNPISAPLKEVLEFLVFCEQKGLSYRTLGVYRSAIALYHEPVDDISLGKSLHISRLMKGFFNRNPPKPRYSCTWEVEPVLKFLKQMPSWKALSLKMLTLKVVLLLALVSAKRVSSLVHVDLKTLVVSNNFIKFIPSSLLKQSRPNYTLKSVVIEAFEDKQLCPVQAISTYLKKTKGIRGSETQLLISHLKPHNKVTSSTVSRWIIQMMKIAGVNTEMFKAHSTRGAATSASHKLGVSMRDIQETAGWKSDSTFSRFYHKPTADSVVARTLLGAASKSHSDSKPKEGVV